MRTPPPEGASSCEPMPGLWQGLRAAAPLSELESGSLPPEPAEPQGEYGPAQTETSLGAWPLGAEAGARSVELLAPAGGLEAGFAAFHYGADAAYLGLKKFSARAEAENFSLEEVDELTAYAHRLPKPRRVFVALNTLVLQHELVELIETLGALDEIGVDALIVQDLGVYALAHRHFPGLELHASTQMAVHDRAGAETLRRLGFARVVLARELTFEEVRDITAASGLETEVFVHGALCYSYSGLCLFSSQAIGRSGNRGKCAYTCRDRYTMTGAPDTLRDGTPVKRNPASGFPFSMKDLALPDHLPALRAAGVSCFKIEGRKKSPLYVASVTDFYRQLLDGTLVPEDRPAREADLQTVFSRPWTGLFQRSHRDKEVADRDATGHRGAWIGQVDTVVQDSGGPARLRFHTRRRLELHDGLQIELPPPAPPFGFAVERLGIQSREGRARKRWQTAFEASAGSWVEVELPSEAPPVPLDAKIYCSSSQAVKQKYRIPRPKPGQFRARRRVRVDLLLEAGALAVVLKAEPRREGEASVEVQAALPGPFSPAGDPLRTAEAARRAFQRLGDTRLELLSCRLQNPQGLFVPLSRLNELRRRMAVELEEALCAASTAHLAEVIRTEGPALPASPRPKELSEYKSTNSVGARASSPPIARAARMAALQRSNFQTAPQEPFRWSLKVDRLSFLEAFQAEDWAGVREVAIEIARDGLPLFQARLPDLARRLGPGRIRLALPALVRKWEERGLRQKIEGLRAAGWNRWEAANLGAWTYLGVDPLTGTPACSGTELSADWPVYVVNRMAARQALDMGARGFTLSPEDGLANMRALLAEFGAAATVIVHQDTPLFLSESCAYANLIGGCPGKANCRFERMEMVSSYGERFTALDHHCRTIVLNKGAYCLAHRLKDLAKAGAVSLRADFLYRAYEPEQVRDAWRLLRSGRNVPGGHAANFKRGLL